MLDRTEIMHKLATKICLILAILSQAVYGTTYLKEIPASDVLAKIDKNELIMYDHVIIKGDLDVNNLTLLGKNDNNHIRSSIIIRNSRIDGNVSVRLFTFEGYVNFRGSQFNGTSDYLGSQFSNVADFTNTKFNGNARFSASKFNGMVLFDGTQFNGEADFTVSQFSTAVFIDSMFNGMANFGETEFNGLALFDGTQFNGEADFLVSKFNDVASFNRTKFNGNADFRESQFERSTVFKGDRFGLPPNFNGAKFDGYVSDWASLKSGIFDEKSYLSLIKSLRETGLFGDANDCYYTYRIHHMSNLFDYLSWMSCGFGVSWLQTIYFGIFWLISFGLVYFIMISDSNEINDIHKLFEALGFSAVVLLSVPSELYPRRTSKYKEYAKQIKFPLPILERLIGWGLLILFINTLSRLMIQY